MSLTYNQIEFICQEITPILIGQKLQDFYAMDARTFILQFASRKLLLCLQQPFLRFHLSQVRQKKLSTPLSQRIGSLIIDKTFTSLEVLNEDRIVKFTFENRALIAEFFPRKPNLYLIDRESHILLSLVPTSNPLYSVPEKPQLQTRSLTTPPLDSNSLEKLYSEKEKQARLEKRKLLLQQQLVKQVKKLDTLHKRYQECKEWPKAYHEAQLLQANFYRLRKGMKSIHVEDWENEGKEYTLVVNPLLDPHEEIAKRFKQSKKLRLGETHMQGLINQQEKEIDLLRERIEKIEEAPEEEKLLSEKKPEKKPVAKVYREFFSEAGLAIWVGKRDKDNEVLTFQLGRGSDWWMHVHDFPGSHVILRCPKSSTPDQESILDAAQLSIYFSKAKNQLGAEVCLTQCKYVSKMGKEKGKVQISKHKVISVKTDEKRLQRLLHQ